jgi:high-affinity iron transporter
VALVSYVRSLAARPEAITARGAADSASAEGVSRHVLGILDQALRAARGGRASDAGDKAFDAYIAFEPLESKARAKNPGAVARMERLFADFKAAASANDVRGAERARDAIAAGLPQIVELTRPTEGMWGAFWQSFLIILREGFEAILVVGAVVTFLVKTGHREKLRSIWVGVGAALVASAVMAVVLKTVLANAPASREVIEGVTMLVAVAVLFSVSYWLISKVEAAKWQQFIRDQVNAALSHGGGRALATVAFLAVFREGAETALFYQALLQEGSHTLGPIVLGVLVGGLVLAALFTMFYRYGVKLPLRPFFAVTSGLLYYMAFVFLGKGLKELQEGNAMPATVLPGFPHVEALGIYPTRETLLAQLVLLLLLGFALVKTFWPKRSVQLPTVEPAAVAAAAAAAAIVAPHVHEDTDVRVARLAERVVALQAKIDVLEARLADARLGDAGARETATAASGD